MMPTCECGAADADDAVSSAAAKTASESVLRPYMWNSPKRAFEIEGSVDDLPGEKKMRAPVRTAAPSTASRSPLLRCRYQARNNGGGSIRQNRSPTISSLLAHSALACSAFSA